MKAGQGKAKGGKFEREMCEKISRWLSNGERKDLLCRTVSSGGQFTTGKKKGEFIGLAGDLRAQDSVIAFQFCKEYVIECKHWDDLHLQDFFLQSGELFEAICKVADEGKFTQREWMLIAKQNYKSILVFVPSYRFPRFSMTGELPYHTFAFPGRGLQVAYARFDQFLKNFKPEHLIHQL